MTSRERVFATAHGSPSDRKPLLGWPYGNGESDFRVFDESNLPDQVPEGDRLALVEVTNPFGLALQRRMDLNQLLKEDPRTGNEALSELVETTGKAIDLAFQAGADGVLYRLYGARASHCTPMQYGGYYLERDRELLERAGQGRFNIVFVVGEDDVYLDFVSDLPANAFGWDSVSSRIVAADVRTMREGPLVSEDPESEILLDPSTANLSRMLETCVRTEDSYAI